MPAHIASLTAHDSPIGGMPSTNLVRAYKEAIKTNACQEFRAAYLIVSALAAGWHEPAIPVTEPGSQFDMNACQCLLIVHELRSFGALLTCLCMPAGSINSSASACTAIEVLNGAICKTTDALETGIPWFKQAIR